MANELISAFTMKNDCPKHADERYYEQQLKKVKRIALYSMPSQVLTVTTGELRRMGSIGQHASLSANTLAQVQGTVCARPER